MWGLRGRFHMFSGKIDKVTRFGKFWGGGTGPKLAVILEGCID